MIALRTRTATGAHAASRSRRTKLSRIDLGERLPDRLLLVRPHQPRGFLAVLQEDQRRPELDPERAPEALATRVRDLDVPHIRVLGESGPDQRLGRAAPAAPRAAELDHRGAFERVYFGALGLGFDVVSGHRHIDGIAK